MAKSSPYALLPTSLTMYTQSNALKDERDLSKNLVGGDFESRGSDKSVNGKRKTCGVVLVLALTISYVWLIGLTVVRELQLAKLKDDVGQLSANLLALEARVNNNKIFDDFKNLEDTVSRLRKFKG